MTDNKHTNDVSASEETNQLNQQQQSQSQQQSQQQFHNPNGNYYSGGYMNGYNSSGTNTSGKPYNKHFNNRNGYGNNNNGNNRQHYNNRKNYNNQKINHHNPSYGGFAGYPANMYAYGYYPNPYGYPASMVPGISPIPGYPSPQQGLGQLPGSSGKFKLTDKEGKPIDLEEKKKLTSASNTPLQSPSLSITSPVGTFTSPAAPSLIVVDERSSKESNVPSANASPSFSSQSSQSTVDPNAAAKLSVAEEFKRKILERAAKAVQKSESTSDTKEKKVDAVKPKDSTELQASKAPIAPEEKESQAEETESAKVAHTPEPKSMTPKEPSPAPEQAAEEQSIRKAEVEESEAKIAVKENESGAIQVSAPEVQGDKPETSEILENVPDLEKPIESAALSDTISEPIESSAAQQSSIETPGDDVEENKQPVENKTPSEPVDADTTADAEEDIGDEGAHVDEDQEEETFNLSNFFDHLKTVKNIEDPYTITYPSPFVGVDSTRKIEGKKYRYDPQFLMQFRDAIQYPVDEEWKTKLDNLGIVATSRRGPSSQSSRGVNRFGGPLAGRFGGAINGRGQFNDGRQNSRSGSRRRGGGSGSSRDRSARKGNQSRRGKDKDDDHKPAEDVKPLEKSANRWVPRSRAKKTEVTLAPDGSEILEPEDVERKVNSLLNKLTLELFDTITDDILAISNQSKWEDDARTVRRIISLTFAKACDEPYWSSMYAQFCAKMCTSLSDEIKDSSIILKTTGQPANGGDLARRILLTTCQTEYEKGWSDKLPTNTDGTPLEPEMMSEQYYIMAAAKRRGLGLVKFIGHLYILGMLNDQVILLCLRDQSKNIVDPSEDALENLAQLVQTVGAKLETTEKNRAVLNLVFDNIQTILDNCKLSSRIKFMLMDLQDLRAAKWISSKTEAGPKTIQEIHDEAELKKMEEERANAEKRRRNRNNEPRSNSSRSGSSWGNNAQSKRSDSRIPSKGDSFTSVQSRSQSNRLTNPQSSDTGFQRENSKRTESVQSNMFAALGGDEDENNDEEAAAADDHNNSTLGAQSQKKAD